MEEINREKKVERKKKRKEHEGLWVGAVRCGFR
jgi:hypothetical protein